MLHKDQFQDMHQFNHVNYICLQETVYNGPIVQSDWFAIYLKMVTYVRNPDLKTEIIAVTKFLILFTEDYVCKYYTAFHKCSLCFAGMLIFDTDMKYNCNIHKYTTQI